MKPTLTHGIVLLASISIGLSGCAAGGTGALFGPSAKPSGTPSAALDAAPATLTFTTVGASSAQTFAATESAYTGTITETDTCSGLATVAATGGTSGASVTFGVTPSAVGTCTVTVHDSYGQKAAVSISITTSGLVVQ